MQKRPVIKIVGHYMMENGHPVEIDPADYGLPDRCKLALAEFVTGESLELEQAQSGS